MPWLVLFAILIAPAEPAGALPHPDDTIDPSKRAPISTKDAVRPAATVPVGSGIVGDGRIPDQRATIEVAPTDKTRAPIVVNEARKKSITRPSERTANVKRDYKSGRSSRLPASIPRLDVERFGKALAEYREGKNRPTNLANLEVRVGKETVDIGAINRFANPRATLEAQGIPVTSAASGVSPESAAVPVPIKKQSAAKAE